MSKLLEEVRDLIRTRHYSYRIEEAYLNWIRQYLLFHGKRHPAEMGAASSSLRAANLLLTGWTCRLPPDDVEPLV